MESLLFYKTGRTAARVIRMSARGTVRLYVLFLAGILLASCAEPVIVPAYRVSFPEPPAVWTEALGPPSWELYWVDSRGALQSARHPEGGGPRVELAQNRATPLLARPFWPEVLPAGRQTDGQIPIGVMKSAGAVFPFDADGGIIRLSWEGGVSAGFYLALARARLALGDGTTGGVSPADKRRPEWFDWPRFRALLGNDGLPEEVREDPWLVDWDAVAAKTVESGWNSRRIRAVERTPFTVTIPADGPWFGTSPFAPARSWKAGDRVEIPAREIPEFLLSPDGYLQYTKSDYIWHKWER
ncbi:MAG: hypothetical protein LBF77_09985 [Spirochaetaceae bacterium]|nr:hypothetical protein [Spirochaetaceae bacterium]